MGERGDGAAEWVRAHPRFSAGLVGGALLGGLVEHAGAPLAVTVLVACVGAAAGPWLMRGRRPEGRSKIEIVGGSPWPWHGEFWWARRKRAELKRIVENWPWRAQAARIPHSVITLAAADIDEGIELHIRLAHGQVPKDVPPDRLASAIREFQHHHVPGDRPYEIIVREILPEDSIEPDELHDDEPVHLHVTPEPVDVTEQRFELILTQLTIAREPLSGREIAKRTGLNHDTVWRSLLPTLLERGEVRKVNGKWSMAPGASSARESA